jgi:hypothetical protein
VTPTSSTPAGHRDESTPAVIHPIWDITPPSRPAIGYREHVGRSKRQNNRQLSLF